LGKLHEAGLPFHENICITYTVPEDVVWAAQYISTHVKCYPIEIQQEVNFEVDCTT